MKHKDIPNKDRLIFAMDVPDCDRARALAEELGDAVTFYKIGLELMMSGEYFELLDWCWRYSSGSARIYCYSTNRPTTSIWKCALP